jgi:hypothetical protein
MKRVLEDSAFARLLFQALARRGLKPKVGEPAASPAKPEGERQVKRSHRVRAGKVQHRRIKRQDAPTAPVAHIHLEVKHAPIPHPRYGERVPYFRTWREYSACTCDDARVTSSIRRRLRRDARMRLQPAVVDVHEQTAPVGTSGTKQQLCGRKTKLGTPCRRPARESGACAWHERMAYPEPAKLGRGA